jgi:hypothetical protein
VLGLEEAHRHLRISPAEFDEVAAELARTLDSFNVPAREKEEVLGAFAAHKDEVTQGVHGRGQPLTSGGPGQRGEADTQRSGWQHGKWITRGRWHRLRRVHGVGYVMPMRRRDERDRRTRPPLVAFLNIRF